MKLVTNVHVLATATNPCKRFAMNIHPDVVLCCMASFCTTGAEGEKGDGEEAKRERVAEYAGNCPGLQGRAVINGDHNKDFIVGGSDRQCALLRKRHKTVVYGRAMGLRAWRCSSS